MTLSLEELNLADEVDRSSNWITWIILILVYALFLASTYFHSSIPTLALFLLGGFTIAWFGSVQHELIHDHPSRYTWLNEMLGFPPLNPFLPFKIYKESHILHHQSKPLTMPGEDTESYYLDYYQWENSNRLTKSFWIIYQTFVGRMIFGPVVTTGQFLKEELGLAMRPSRLFTWVIHLLGCLVLLQYLIWIELPFWKYLICFVYPGVSLTMMRSYAEHRPAENPMEQSILINAHPFFRLLYLDNNLHLVHHHHQSEPWWRLRQIFEANREEYIKASNGFYYEGYWEIVRKYLFTPRDNPVHPKFRS